MKSKRTHFAIDRETCVHICRILFAWNCHLLFRLLFIILVFDHVEPLSKKHPTTSREFMIPPQMHQKHISFFFWYWKFPFFPPTECRWPRCVSAARHTGHVVSVDLWHRYVWLGLCGGTGIVALFPHIRNALFGHIHLYVRHRKNLWHPLAVVFYCCSSAGWHVSDDGVAGRGDGGRTVVWQGQTWPYIWNLE